MKREIIEALSICTPFPQTPIYRALGMLNGSVDDTIVAIELASTGGMDLDYAAGIVATNNARIAMRETRKRMQRSHGWRRIVHWVLRKLNY